MQKETGKEAGRKRWAQRYTGTKKKGKTRGIDTETKAQRDRDTHRAMGTKTLRRPEEGRELGAQRQS